MLKPRLFLCLLVLIMTLAGVSHWTTRSASFQIIQDPGGSLSDMGIAVDFQLPMRQEDLTDKIFLVAENPQTLIHYKVSWLNRTTALISLTQNGSPQGQLISVQITGARTLFPLIKKTVGAELRPQIPLRLISKTNFQNIPSKGPLPIKFNTPVDPRILKAQIVLPVPGRLTPERIYFNNKTYTDYSSWYYHPDKPFRQGAAYTLVLKPGIQSLGGSQLRDISTIIYTIAPAPRVLSSKPEKNADRVHLYHNIEITTDKPLRSASLEVVEPSRKRVIRGSTTIEGSKIIFRPSECFMPEEIYKVRLTGESTDHEPINEYIYYFNTVSMNNRLWVEVNLGSKHTMTVYRGNKVIRTMLASGGKKSTPTPLGTFYTKDRGHSFFSPRFGEGATYWVRLVDQILIHSVPRDHRWQLKEDEHDKLGLPASHGCVRLSEDNARWFFENVPGGTPVIIHK